MSALKTMPISFPGLFGGLEFNPDPVALHIGHGIYWYGIIIALGMLGGLFLAMKQAPRLGVKENDVTDLILWAVPLCILGARLYYVIFYYSLYRTESGAPDWGKMIAIWDGGLAIYGSVITAVVVTLIFCHNRKLKFAAMADVCIMGLILGQAVGRWGNFINREAFGSLTTLPWRMKLWTSATQSIEVHPTFLYESLWNIVGLLLMLFVVTKARRFDGENFCFYLLWYGLGRFWIEGLRTDSLYLFNWTLMGQPIRVSQALSAIMVIGATIVLFYQLKCKSHTPNELWVNQMKAASKIQAETEKTEEQKNGNSD